MITKKCVKVINAEFQLLGVVTYNCDFVRKKDNYEIFGFQLLGVVTYNCDAIGEVGKKVEDLFQLLGVVTYNCD